MATQDNYLQRGYIKLIRDPLVRTYIKLQRDKFPAQDALVITGSPRSGTTWLESIFAAPSGISTITEPLHLKRRGVKERGFSWRTFVPPDQKHSGFKEYFAALFSGRIANGYNTRDTLLVELLNTRTWLIKFVRANRLLPWLVENFKFKYKPVLIVRHPCGVVYSQMKHPVFSRVREGQIGNYDMDLIECYFPKFQPLLSGLHTEEEIRALTWALDNFIPLHYWAPEKWIVLSYEQLVLDSQAVLQRVYSEWQRPLPSEALSKVGEKSREAKEWSQFDKDGMKKLGSWQKHFTKQQISAILDVVHKVGLVEFSKDIEPDYDRLYAGHFQG